ncbi:hypothetical protein D3OALGB2SA_4112 [Olavius algarvensis associated proteobacterium Delta 3]|nr:hypothetical protein D3OALGB2SA_4112 [Olavius algarvensis associated proteobacterium Delta 3]
MLARMGRAGYWMLDNRWAESSKLKVERYREAQGLRLKA